MSTRVTRRAPAATGLRDERSTEIYYWWLLIALFFEYARPASFLPGLAVLKLNSLIPLSLLAAVLLAKGFRSFGEIFQDTGSRWLAAYLCLTVISIPFAAVPIYAVDKFIEVLGYFFLFLIIARVVTSFRRLYGVFAALVFSHLFLIAMSPDIIFNMNERSTIKGATFLGDGNDFALSVCLLLPMTVGIALRTRSRMLKPIIWSSAAILVIAVLGTQSRGATVGLIALAGYFWWGSKRKLVTGAVIVVAVSIIGLFASQAYLARIGTIANYQEDGSAEGRIIAWKGSIQMALHNPVLGVGLGNFPTEFGSKYKPRDLNIPWLTAHSTYFLVLGELGIPGLVVLLSLVVGAVPATLRVRRRVIAAGAKQPTAEADDASRALYLLSGSVIGFAVPGAFLSAAYYPHLFVLTGALVAARCIATKQVEAGALPAKADGRRPVTASYYRRGASAARSK